MESDAARTIRPISKRAPSVPAPCPPAKFALLQSLSRQLDARVLNFTCALKSSATFRQLVIWAAVETSADRARLHQPAAQKLVADTLRPSLAQSECASEGTLPELLVGFTAVEDIELMVAIAAIKGDVAAIAKTHAEHIWMTSANGPTTPSSSIARPTSPTRACVQCATRSS